MLGKSPWPLSVLIDGGEVGNLVEVEIAAAGTGKTVIRPITDGRVRLDRRTGCQLCVLIAARALVQHSILTVLPSLSAKPK